MAVVLSKLILFKGQSLNRIRGVERKLEHFEFSFDPFRYRGRVDFLKSSLMLMGRSMLKGNIKKCSYKMRI